MWLQAQLLFIYVRSCACRELVWEERITTGLLRSGMFQLTFRKVCAPSDHGAACISRGPRRQTAKSLAARVAIKSVAQFRVNTASNLVDRKRITVDGSDASPEKSRAAAFAIHATQLSRSEAKNATHRHRRRGRIGAHEFSSIDQRITQTRRAAQANSAALSRYPVLEYHPVMKVDAKAGEPGAEFFVMVELEGAQQAMERWAGLSGIMYDEKVKVTTVGMALSLCAVLVPKKPNVGGMVLEGTRWAHSAHATHLVLTNTVTEPYQSAWLTRLRRNLKCGDPTCTHEKTVERWCTESGALGFHTSRLSCAVHEQPQIRSEMSDQCSASISSALLRKAGVSGAHPVHSEFKFLNCAYHANRTHDDKLSDIFPNIAATPALLDLATRSYRILMNARSQSDADCRLQYIATNVIPRLSEDIELCEKYTKYLAERVVADLPRAGGEWRVEMHAAFARNGLNATTDNPLEVLNRTCVKGAEDGRRFRSTEALLETLNGVLDTPEDVAFGGIERSLLAHNLRAEDSPAASRSAKIQSLLAYTILLKNGVSISDCPWVAYVQFPIAYGSNISDRSVERPTGVSGYREVTTILRDFVSSVEAAAERSCSPFGPAPSRIECSPRQRRVTVTRDAPIVECDTKNAQYGSSESADIGRLLFFTAMRSYVRLDADEENSDGPWQCLTAEEMYRVMSMPVEELDSILSTWSRNHMENALATLVKEAPSKIVHLHDHLELSLLNSGLPSGFAGWDVAAKAAHLAERICVPTSAEARERAGVPEPTRTATMSRPNGVPCTLSHDQMRPTVGLALPSGYKRLGERQSGDVIGRAKARRRRPRLVQAENDRDVLLPEANEDRAWLLNSSIQARAGRDISQESITDAVRRFAEMSGHVGWAGGTKAKRKRKRKLKQQGERFELQLDLDDEYRAYYLGAGGSSQNPNSDIGTTSPPRRQRRKPMRRVKQIDCSALMADLGEGSCGRPKSSDSEESDGLVNPRAAPADSGDSGKRARKSLSSTLNHDDDMSMDRFCKHLASKTAQFSTAFAKVSSEHADMDRNVELATGKLWQSMVTLLGPCLLPPHMFYMQNYIEEMIETDELDATDEVSVGRSILAVQRLGGKFDKRKRAKEMKLSLPKAVQKATPDQATRLQNADALHEFGLCISADKFELIVEDEAGEAETQGDEVVALTVEETRVLLNLWNGSIDQSLTVCYAKQHAITLTRNDFATLCPGRFLNDNVINAYIDLLLRDAAKDPQAPRVWAAPTHFYSFFKTHG